MATTDQSSSDGSLFNDLAASPPAPSVALGDRLRDTATVSNFSGQAGSVSFTLYGPLANYPTDTQSCPSSPIAFGPNVKSAPTGTGSPASYTSDSFRPTSAGNYLWVARYSPPGGTVGRTSDCRTEEVTVSRASPAITTEASPSAVTVGAQSTVGDKATLHGGSSVAPPTGLVTFTLFTDPSCSNPAGVSGNGAITTSGGVSTATFSTSWTPSTTGTYYWIATYSGDTNNNPSTTSCGNDGEQVTVGS
jgi:hypothetical protein